MPFGINDIHSASKRIGGHINNTPLIRAQGLDEMLGCEVYLKAECMQKTGSFKLRGALNMILSLSEESMKNGIVTASSGNHGKGCAYAAKALNIPAVVVVPSNSAPVKIQAIRDMGAEVVLCEASERFRIAEDICKERNAVFIPPYNDELIMAGQGTAGLEITEQLPDADFVIVPTSGGGLLSGVATAVKETSSAKVIGAEPAVIPRYTESIKAGKIVEVPQRTTVADALISNHPGSKCFPVVQKYVDGIAKADEEYILKAQKLLLTEGKVLAEASSCTGIAAVMQGNIKFNKTDKVCFLLSGGNCSLEQLAALTDI